MLNTNLCIAKEYHRDSIIIGIGVSNLSLILTAPLSSLMVSNKISLVCLPNNSLNHKLANILLNKASEDLKCKHEVCSRVCMDPQ